MRESVILTVTPLTAVQYNHSTGAFCQTAVGLCIIEQIRILIFVLSEW